MTDVITTTDSTDLLLLPTHDYAFKRIFGDSKHTAVLINFLNSIVQCKEPIIQVTLDNIELVPENSGDKWPRLDVLATTQDGEIINIEMQLDNKGYTTPRALFYWSRLFSRQLKAGENYSHLKRTIAINILDFNLFKQDEKRYWRQCRLIDTKDHSIITELMEIHFLELKKMQALRSNSTTLENWIEFLRNPYSPEVCELAKTIPQIAKAQDILARVNHDPAAREWLRVYEKAILDEASALAYAENTGKAKGLAEGKAEGLTEGKAEGKAEGRAEGRAEGIAIGEAKGKTKGKLEALNAVAINLAKQGMTASQIAKLTNLSTSDIEKLQH